MYAVLEVGLSVQQGTCNMNAISRSLGVQDLGAREGPDSEAIESRQYALGFLSLGST